MIVVVAALGLSMLATASACDSGLVQNVTPYDGATTGLHPWVGGELSVDCTRHVYLRLDDKLVLVGGEITGRDFYYRSTPLSEGTHTASLEVLDCEGNQDTRAWAFNVVTRQAVVVKRPSPLEMFWGDVASVFDLVWSLV